MNFVDYMKARVISACCLVALVFMELHEMYVVGINVSFV